MARLWCSSCCVTWPRRRRRQWCIACHTLLVDRELTDLPPFIRPGVFATGEDRQLLDARAHPGAGAGAAREAGAGELEEGPCTIQPQSTT